MVTLAIGLNRRLSVEHAARMRDRVHDLLPDAKVIFIEDASHIVPLDSEADLIIAATRLHDALYCKGGEMEEYLGTPALIAYGELQQALKRRGWTGDGGGIPAAPSPPPPGRNPATGETREPAARPEPRSR